jgi:asparagine synthase
MSSISGEFFKAVNAEAVPLLAVQESNTFISSRYRIQVKGKSNLTFKIDEVQYIISGSGIDSNFKLMSANNWISLLKKNEDIRNLDGHFLILKIEKDKIQIFNDQLGLREIFLYEAEDKIIFSTRIDQLLNNISNIELNNYFLCSLWSHANPIVYETMIKGVKILGPGGTAKLDSRSLEINYDPWLPKKSNLHTDGIVEIIDSTIRSLLEQENQINLGLSGGMDSRTLLSILFSHDKKRWSTYTFGQRSDLDVKIANLMARSMKLNHYHYDSSPFCNDDIMGTWKEFVSETNCILPAHYYHKLSYYKLLPEGEFFIDGGKGEYIRRGLSNRLAKLGKKTFLSKDLSKIKSLLLVSKPNFFSKDILKTWDQYLEDQITKLMETMPDVFELGFENWLDLFNIRYRTGNTGYISQGRLDGIVRNIMPLIQPSILSIIFNIPYKKRERGDVNRKILNRNFSLNLYPLAHDGTLIPFQHNKYTSFAWKKFMKLFIQESSKDLYNFLNINKNYILSRLSDPDYLNSAIYDRKIIETNVTEYYKGNFSKAYFVVWWLTFDHWHKMIFAH